MLYYTGEISVSNAMTYVFYTIQCVCVCVYTRACLLTNHTEKFLVIIQS